MSLVSTLRYYVFLSHLKYMFVVECMTCQSLSDISLIDGLVPARDAYRIGHKMSGFGSHSGMDGFRSFSVPKSLVFTTAAPN